MKRQLTTVVFLCFIAIIAWGVYKKTNSQRTSFIVACVGVAASLVPIFIPQNEQSQNFKSKVNVKNASQSEIAGISYSGNESMPSSIESEMEIGDIEGGSVKGVEWNSQTK